MTVSDEASDLDNTTGHESSPPSHGGHTSGVVVAEDAAGSALGDPLDDPLDDSSIGELGAISPLDEEPPPPMVVSAAQVAARRAARIPSGSFYAPVFIPALGILILAVALAFLAPNMLDRALTSTMNWIGVTFTWYYVLVAAIFVIFALWMGLSRFGDIILGADDDVPEFGWLTWFCMLFAAGMGIGLMFWGVAEPLSFFHGPKPGTDITGVSPDGTPVMATATELARNAMSQTFLHWGLHAWAIYVVVGLALAYSIHRRGNPVSIRWALEPVLGRHIHGRWGDLIDITAVVGTVAGVATSLGLGVQQIAAGLEFMGATSPTAPGEQNTVLLVGLIIGITAVAIFSVVSGVDRGIKWLSNINLGFAAIFMVAVALLGPTLFIFREFVESVGLYFQSWLSMTFDTGAMTGDEGVTWVSAWTIFYWGWWISWAPFVGVFIARISKGRTVREFVLGVLVVPLLVTFTWFTVMGGSALYRELFGEGGLIDPETGVNVDQALFQMLEPLPASGLLSGLAIVLIAIFFITSSDSGSLVVDMLASGGNEDPPTWSRVMWSVLEGAVALSLLLAGGLLALRAGAIITALPFSVVMLLMCVATYRSLSMEHDLLVRAQRRVRREQLAAELGGEVTGELTDNFDEHFGTQVDDRVTALLGRRLGRWRKKR